ncbi:MAG: cation:proton antiporter, partial [Pirellulales bacterium]|nr:cation:proton antiporter [Pirellulales bacterium]
MDISNQAIPIAAMVGRRRGPCHGGQGERCLDKAAPLHGQAPVDTWQILLNIVLLLAGSLILGGISSRLGQSPLVGYILAGMLLGGPGSVHLIGNEAEIDAIAELGVSLLLFGLGLEFSWSRLRSLGKQRLVGGVLQVLATAAVGSLVAAGIGLGAKEALAIGAVVSLSSTACVLRVLADAGDLDGTHGRSCLAVLLVQDIAVIPLAVYLTLLSEGGSFGAVSLQLLKLVV